MSWDVFLFNTKERITDFESFNADKLEPIDFGEKFQEYFSKINKGEVWEIIGEDFEIIYYPSEVRETNCLLNLYGKKAIYALIDLSKKNGWQVFDTAFDGLLDLDDPAKNGYKNYRDYLLYVLGEKLDRDL